MSHRRYHTAVRTRSRYNKQKPSKQKNKKEYIPINRFIKAAIQQEDREYTATNTFGDFAVHELLAERIKQKGYKTPSPIQDQAILPGLAGRDVLGVADTGTGKTAAFAIPILHNLLCDDSKNAIILAPTRELAQQIESEFRAIAKGSGLTGALLIGGVAMGPQFRDLHGKPRIIIGTPGRVKDHMQRGSLDVSRFNIAALDEVDRMLDMGFVHDITHILESTPSTRQSYFFSATLNPRVRKIIDTFSDNPVHISIAYNNPSGNVHQDVVKYRHASEKADKLHDILLQDIVSKTIIFNETQVSVESLCSELLSRGFKVDALHGGKSQSQRQRALRRFKENSTNVLVATDVAARGIDVSDISHIINYTTPNSYSDYIHRIGRAGRAGRTGYALTFVGH